MRIMVTGASGALGRATVKILRDAGNQVACIDRSASGDESPLHFACNDLANAAQADACVAAAVKALGGLDAVAHLVGTFDYCAVADSSVELWQRLFACNLETTLVVVQSALRHLQAGAAIVTVGAAATASAGRGMAAYTASKSAVARLTESLAIELATRAIRINLIAPGTIDTPANRDAMPEVDPATWSSPIAIAETIAFLLSSSSRAINGATIPVCNSQYR